MGMEIVSGEHIGIRKDKVLMEHENARVEYVSLFTGNWLAYVDENSILHFRNGLTQRDKEILEIYIRTNR